MFGPYHDDSSDSVEQLMMEEEGMLVPWPSTLSTPLYDDDDLIEFGSRECAAMEARCVTYLTAPTPQRHQQH